MPTTTAGQLLVNDALPEDMQRPSWDLDKKGITELFRELHDKHPDQYAQITQKIMSTGHNGAQAGGLTLHLNDLLPTPEVQGQLDQLKGLVSKLSQSDMPDDQKEKRIQDLIIKAQPEVDKALYQSGIESGNSLAGQVQSGSRGNVSNLRQIQAGDMLVQDHRGRVIPVPILNGYGAGLSPTEYFAGSYGARTGVISTKYATMKYGFLSKILALVNHRLVVTQKDCGTSAGLPVRGDDHDNIGAVLAMDVGTHKAGTIITPQMIKQFKGKRIVVRSPTTCQADQGICAKCAGTREHGKLPEIGENLGVAASQAVAEPLAQSGLGAKHGGGAIGSKNVNGGFEHLNSLINTPKSFEGAAAIAQADGRIDSITPAPQGGTNIKIGEHDHYVSPDLTPSVKAGDKVYAGDMLSDGTPNPAEIVKHKGIGEGRRQFVDTFSQALKASGAPAHRRNVEMLARGLINHVQITGMDNNVANTLIDDIIPYSQLSRDYTPREGSVDLPTHRASGMYLEKPAMHYSLGTKLTPPVVKDLEEMGVGNVHVHHEEPQFRPHMVRGMEAGLRDPNPITRLAGSYLERGTLESVHRGRSADIHDTSYVPSLAVGTEFGKGLKETGLY